MTRDCPFCGGGRREVLMEMRAADFVRLNTTYIRDAAERLGVEDGAVFPIVRCSDCGFQYSRELLPPEKLTSLYEECIEAGGSLARTGLLSKRAESLDAWARLLGLHAERQEGETLKARLLDYGCGWGDFLLMARMPGVETFGFETDRRAAGHARGQGLRAAGSLRELEEHAPFDLLVCSQVLEHLPDPRAALADMNRLLAPGAYGYISVPIYEPRRMDALAAALRAGRLDDKNVNPWEHLNYFSSRDFRDLLGDAGFRIVGPAGARTRFLTVDIRFRDLLAMQGILLRKAAGRLWRLLTGSEEIIAMHCLVEKAGPPRAP